MGNCNSSKYDSKIFLTPTVDVGVNLYNGYAKRKSIIVVRTNTWQIKFKIKKTT